MAKKKLQGKYNFLSCKNTKDKVFTHASILRTCQVVRQSWSAGSLHLRDVKPGTQGLNFQALAKACDIWWKRSTFRYFFSLFPLPLLLFNIQNGLVCLGDCFPLHIFRHTFSVFQNCLFFLDHAKVRPGVSTSQREPIWSPKVGQVCIGYSAAPFCQSQK